MASWLDDPAVKAMLPHSKLLEEAFGLTEAEAKAPVGTERKDWAVRRHSPRALARKRPNRASPSRAIKPAA